MPEIANYFEPYEFACKCGCGEDSVEDELLRKLNLARYYYGHPMFVNSGCRCEKHNKKEGGSKTSSHITKPGVKCKATDLRCVGSRKRHLMLDALFWAGFKRIGVNDIKGFIHTDVDKSKDQDVFWIYPPKKKKILNISRRRK